MVRILLVEDDETIVRTLKDFLETEGFIVESTDGQKKALEMLEVSDYDMALLDVSLGDGNGFSLCTAIKKSQMLFDIDNIRVDLDKGVVYKNGQDLFLSALEYRLLLAFINSDGRLLTRSRLLEEIWDVAGDFVNDNTLTVYIKRLRDKIEDNPAEPKIIVTVRGMGYKLGK